MAGMTIANKSASKGLSVGITDELPYGGTCALRGCDPKKVIIGATEVRDFAKRLQGKGIDTIPNINWKDIMAFKQTFVDEMPRKIEKGYKKNGIDTFHSSAAFINENTLSVGNETIQADKVVISSGSKPKVLDFEGGQLAQTSTDFLNLKELPQSLLFIGGGYIAFEDLGNDHGRVLNEDDTGCFFTSEDFEAQTDQDDNVMMKEMSDALLLEDSETETLNYVLSEEGGQMMLEEVFQVSEYKIVLDSNDSILIEDQPDGDNWNYKLLNLDMGRFDISVIANNTSLEIESTDSPTSSTDFFRRSDSAILVSRTEQIT